MTKLTKVALASLMLAGCGLPTTLTDLTGSTSTDAVVSQFYQAYSVQSVGDEMVDGATAASCNVRPGQGPGFLVENLDTDKDEKLSLAELKADTHRPADFTDAKVEELFNKIDTDKDGYLTQAELSVRPEPKEEGDRAQFMITKIDTDSDGKVTLAEMKADSNKPADLSDEMIENLFNKLDADQDGALTAAELEVGPGAKGPGKGRRPGGFRH